MPRRLVLLTALLGLLGLVPSAGAAPPGGGGNGKGGGAAREEIKEKIRAVRIARLIEILDLDEQGAMRLAPVLNRAYDEIGDVTRDSGEARRELRAVIAAPRPAKGPSETNGDARVNALVDRLLANRVKVEAIENRMIGDVRRLLSPAQVGRLVVALPEINHQIQENIRLAVKRGRRGPGEVSPDE